MIFIKADVDTKKLCKFIKNKKEEIYHDSISIIKDYDKLLLHFGIYRGCDAISYKKQLKGKKDIVSGILLLYDKAKLENEKLLLLGDLYETGIEKEKLVGMILDEYKTDYSRAFLWQLGDLLYKIGDLNQLNEYEKIVVEKSFEESRQMIVLLIGKSKNENVVNFLLKQLGDKSIEGHVIKALSNYDSKEIFSIMQKYQEHPDKWVRNIALKYLTKHIDCSKITKI